MNISFSSKINCMITTTSTKWVLIATVITFIFFSILIVGCNKESQNERNHEQIIEEYKLLLYQDKDFIKNYNLDIAITNLNRNKNLIIDESRTSLLFESLKLIKSTEELSHVFASFGYRNPNELVALFNSKASALINVKQKFPYLSQLPTEELKKMFLYSYERVNVSTITNEHKPGCSNNCCDAYVDGMSDCDLDFAIVSGLSILGGAVASVFATPIVGATTVSSGIGGAYLMHEKCSATSARVYRQCMGYSK